MTKSYAYVITYNNPPVDVHQWLESCKGHGANAAIGQLEEGESGTRHIQGFF